MSAKKLGIWLDHHNAHIIEFTTDPMETTLLESKFTHDAKEQSLGKGENNMHNKEQHQQAEYYKSLAAVMRKYEEVLLFGPTHAKNELANSIKADHLFDKIKISVEHADKMTDNQLHAFVRSYFLKHPTALKV